MSPTTVLPKSPGPAFYIDGMRLGMGIDAITGEFSESALDRDFKIVDAVQGGARDSFYFKTMSDVTDLETSVALGNSGSITFPANGLTASSKSSFDFSETQESSTSVMLVVFSWEREGQAKQVSGAKLSSEASSNLAQDSANFRNNYGDYFVYQIFYKTKFTAIWKCTASTNSKLMEFKNEISGSLSAGEMGASGSFTSKLTNAAKNHQVHIEVQFHGIGEAGNTQYDNNDAQKTFNSFRENASPVPYEVLLQHYNVVNHKVPVTINMESELFDSVRKVFASARLSLVLIGVVPGTRSVRIERRERLNRIFEQIVAGRLAFQKDSESLKDAIADLNDLRELLWIRLQRQDLVMEMHNLTYDYFKGKFAVDHENERGAWVASAEGVDGYVLGRIGFNEEELEKYAIQEAEVAEVHRSSQLLQQQVGALEFPRTTGINGFVVGLHIKSAWTDGTNGYWCIGRELSLGTKQAKVEVKSLGSRGMHWKLVAYYIPSSEYEG